MNIRSNLIIVLSLSLSFGIEVQSGAEDWSIRKFNPFGPRTAKNEQKDVAGTKHASKTSQEKPDPNSLRHEREDADQTASLESTPSTSGEIQRRFVRFGRETAAALQRTRQALTPEFDWPKWEPLKIKFPGLMSTAEPEKIVK